MNATIEPAATENKPSLAEIIQSACKRIPPLWTLKNFVAVNPFVGLSNRHFIEAAQLIRKVGHGDMFLPAEYYWEQISSGRIQEKDFVTAMELARRTLPAAHASEIDFSDLAELKAVLAQCRPS